ncbi:MAG TPA: carotenoid oxygenase family protein [Pseudonocardia sp.]|jgi:carotenoid cleavage dioxygenase|uniref:carotenoid oxygenase family protein n=1 Tax=Pseudonocardia sp. TaxID=60912 RepID=UPI002B4B44BB|nr:carotenoid oxygenase family protein [Pseudonocardia sp.]HLU56591.1 carotenoid oxygenase family protein [Pseudonocardia sp.]
MTTTEPSPPPPVDVSAIPQLQGPFAPVFEETTADDLPVEGDLPTELDGVYLRNGPNPRFTPLGSYVYPLEGDGMVHGIWLSDRRARYANRFVRTEALVEEEKAGRALWGGLMTGYTPGEAEVGPELAGRPKALPDINVVRHGGRLLALAESDCPYCLSPSLETLGRETFDGALPAGMTAHPKVDPRTGEMVVFCYQLEAPYLTWATIGPDGVVTRRPTPVSGADRPVMIHDMALTERFVVLVLAPLYFDLRAALSGGSLLSWQPEDGTRIALVPRDGGPVRWSHTDAFWCWHTANAFDEDGHVVLDLVEWTRPGGIVPGPSAGALGRARIDTRTGEVRREQLDRGSMELPRIDDRLIGRPYERIALVAKTGRRDLAGGDHDALNFFDTRSGQRVQWDAGDLAVGEPVFAPRPGTRDADQGWWVAFATNRGNGESWFLVLPAAEPGRGPVARVRIPTRVPLGLHGSWLPTQE